MDKLNRELRDKAVSLGLCRQWQGDWMESKSQQELIEMYVRGIDFCIEHDYPSVDFIKERFDARMLRMNRVFVDEEVENTGSGVYVLNGKCTGVLRFDRFDVATVYVRHECEVVIEAEELARVFVRVYEGASVTVSRKDAAKVFVRVYGVDAEVCAGDGVKVRRMSSEKESGA